MKRLVAHILLFFVLVGPQTLHQLGKLPVLIEHYTEHNGHNHATSIWAFLALHYTAGTPKHDAHGEQLPFKKIVMGLAPFIFTAPVPFRLPFTAPATMAHSPLVLHPGAIFLPIVGTSGAIWQPPRSIATV